MRSILILHGYEGNGLGHWQTWLAGALRERGVAVTYPDLPESDAPKLEPWLRVVRSELNSQATAGHLVVCHSLSCHLWAHLAAVTDEVLAERVVLVAPPGKAETERAFPGLPPGPWDARTLARVAGRTDLVLGEDDPWRSDPRDLADVGVGVHRIPGGRHLNVEAGYGPWPTLLRWLFDPSQPLEGNGQGPAAT